MAHWQMIYQFEKYDLVSLCFHENACMYVPVSKWYVWALSSPYTTTIYIYTYCIYDVQTITNIYTIYQILYIYIQYIYIYILYTCLYIQFILSITNIYTKLWDNKSYFLFTPTLCLGCPPCLCWKRVPPELPHGLFLWLSGKRWKPTGWWF